MWYQGKHAISKVQDRVTAVSQMVFKDRKLKMKYFDYQLIVFFLNKVLLYRALETTVSFLKAILSTVVHLKA